MDSDEGTGLFTVRSGVSGGEVVSEGVTPADLKFDSGSLVRVHGLQSETGKALNGLYGKIIEFDEGTGRYMCDLGTKQMKIKPSNLAM